MSLYGDTGEQVELGASIFVDINHNLLSAVEHFNLSTVDYGAEDSDGLTASGHLEWKDLCFYAK